MAGDRLSLCCHALTFKLCQWSVMSIYSAERKHMFSVLHYSFLEFLAIKSMTVHHVKFSGLQEETKSEYQKSDSYIVLSEYFHPQQHPNNHIPLLQPHLGCDTSVLLISWSDPWGWRGMWCFPSVWRLPPAPVIHRRNAWSHWIPWCTAGWGTPPHQCHPNPVANTTQTIVSHDQPAARQNTHQWGSVRSHSHGGRVGGQLTNTQTQRTSLYQPNKTLSVWQGRNFVWGAKPRTGTGCVSL